MVSWSCLKKANFQMSSRITSNRGSDEMATVLQKKFSNSISCIKNDFDLNVAEN